MIETLHWHTLHPRYLNARSRVLDLGANYGLFSKTIIDRFSCECVAVEPAPVPFSGIPDYIKKMQVAVSSSSGTLSFVVDENNLLASAVSAPDADGSIKVKAVTLPDLLDGLGWPQIDLLKVDIEGSEIDVLAACSDAFISERIAQMTIEFHDFCGLTPLETVRKTLDRLHHLGFYSVRMSRVGHQDTWLINRRLLKISTLELILTRYLIRNWFGAKRMVFKILRQGRE